MFPALSLCAAYEHANFDPAPNTPAEMIANLIDEPRLYRRVRRALSHVFEPDSEDEYHAIMHQHDP